MGNRRTILLAMDFRPASLAAEPVAVRLAGAFGSSVKLLHVLGPPPAPSDRPRPEHDPAERLLRERALCLAGQGLEVERAVAVGAPADAILRAAREVNAALVVMGAGAATEAGCCLGPTAKTVLAHAAAPVLAVRPGGPPLAFRTILCAVDYSAPAAAALRHAARLARRFEARLIVVSVVPATNWLAAVAETGALLRAAAEHQRLWREEVERFLAGADLAGVAWEKQVRHGRPAEEVVRAVGEAQADLLVLGSARPDGLGRLLTGSVSRQVLPRPPCSVMLVKTGVGAEGALDADIRLFGELMSEGRAFLARGDPAAAEARFHQAVISGPYFAPAWEGRASACERLGRTDEAERCRRRACALRGAEGP